MPMPNRYNQFFLLISISALLLSSFLVQKADASNPPQLTIKDVVGNIDAFDGKMVTLEGTIVLTAGKTIEAQLINGDSAIKVSDLTSTHYASVSGRATGIYHSSENRLELTSFSPNTPSFPSPTIEPAPYQSTGSPKLLVIPVYFTDQSNSKTTAEVATIASTMSNYYSENSLHKLNLSVSHVTYWSLMPKTYGYYGDDNHFWEYVNDAIATVDTSVNFANYKFIIIVHAGNDEAMSHVISDIWSMSYIGGVTLSTNDGVVTLGACTVAETDPVGAYAHETGHMLGLPDLYDYSHTQDFVGNWDLMSSGSWNGPPRNIGSSPAHCTSYGKIEMNWLSSSNIATGQINSIYTLEPLETADTALKVIKIPMTATTHYLIEVRQKTGYDAYLPGEGVVILYVDTSLSSGHGIVKMQNNLNAYDVGGVFDEPSERFRVTVLSKSGSSYTVKVGTVQKATSFTITAPSSVKIGDSKNITAVLKDEIGNPLAAIPVRIYVNGTINKTTSTSTTGTVHHLFNPSSTGIYNITFVSEETTNYLATNSFVLIAADPIYLNVATRIPGQTLFTFNGSPITTPESGTSRIRIDRTGTYNLTAIETIHQRAGSRYSFVSWNISSQNSVMIWMNKDLYVDGTWIFQYAYNISYSVIAGNPKNAPTLNGTSEGIPYRTELTKTERIHWLDNNSAWTVTNLIIGFEGERWHTTAATTGKISSSQRLNFVYYHQYLTIFLYTVSGEPIGYLDPNVTYKKHGATISGTANFTDWTDANTAYNFSNPLPGSGTALRWITTVANGTVSMPGTIVTRYNAQYYVTIGAEPVEGGTVSPKSGWINAGTTMLLEPEAALGWQFQYWTGSGSGSYTGNNTIQQLTVNSLIIERAIFYPSLTVNVTLGGFVSLSYDENSESIKGTELKTIYLPKGTEVTIEAKPSSIFYKFDGWRGIETDGSEQTSLNLTHPMTVKADFSYNYLNIGLTLGGSLAIIVSTALILRRRKRKIS